MKNSKKDRLKANWNDNGFALNCNAEVRIYDPESDWQCFVLAMNPDDEDEILCIIDGFDVTLETWTMKKLMRTYNKHGEFVFGDPSFRPVLASELFKKLKIRKGTWNQKE